MEIKFDPKIIEKARRLTQTSQSNPLRWMCLKHLEEETFTHTTPWFRCKDYFNDSVVWFHQKQKFSIYGMSSNEFHFNEDGSMYVGVSNITSQFENNLKLLDKIEEGMGCKVSIVGKTEEVLSTEIHEGLEKDSTGMTVLHFSKECFLSTFRISMITWLIRMANVSKKYETYLDVFKDTAAMEKVTNFSSVVKPKLPLLDFSKLDEKGYSWFYGAGQNSQQIGKITSYESGWVHNAGANQWIYVGVFE
jgi:hypothetical protein